MEQMMVKNLKKILVDFYPILKRFPIGRHIRQRLRSKYIGKKIFKKSAISYSDDGYYFLKPMPSQIELEKYYESFYWHGRSEVGCFLIERDLKHYDIIRTYKLIEGAKRVLNFGAGHGGVSFLLAAFGCEVINIDPDKSRRDYSSYFKSFGSINDVKSHSVDFIYASHSLEHVRDINLTLEELKRVASPKCKFLFEVPNAEFKGEPSNGGGDGAIYVPHTYYFTPKFFKEKFPYAFTESMDDDLIATIGERARVILSWGELRSRER
jgi:SAM-dependent methyltransferase